MNGGGGGFRGRLETIWQPQDLQSSMDRTRQQRDSVETAELFDSVVSEINQVDTDGLNGHKQEILDALQPSYPGSIDLRGGGSYTKHTYVDGLSDVDVLLDLGSYGDSQIPNKDDVPAILEEAEKQLQSRLPGAKISAGRMAVTVEFADGQQIQVLPAFCTKTTCRIPSPEGEGWVTTRPQVFAQLLRDRNAEVSGRLLRCIKLAKRICHAQGVEIKSYHLENIAVVAFDKYTGPKSDPEMLRHLFNRAKELVTKPMRDVTGQEEHVDRYLSSAPDRTNLSQGLARIERTMRNAENPEAWRNILG